MSLSGSISSGSGVGGTGGLGGSTGSTDKALLRASGAGGATVQSSGVLLQDDNSMSGILSARKAGAGGATLTAADSGKTVTIQVGGGDDDITLPAAPTLGTFYRFVIIGIDRLTVHAQGSQVIYNGAIPSSAAGTITSNVKGSVLRIELVANNVWAVQSSGTWTTT